MQGTLVDFVAKVVRVQTRAGPVTAIEAGTGQDGDVLVVSPGAVQHPVVQQIRRDAETSRTLEVGVRTAVLFLLQLLQSGHTQAIHM